MGIKKLHDHPDKTGTSCWLNSYHGHPLTNSGQFLIGTTVITAGYWGYTGHWYLFDDNGKEQGSVRREFFETVFEPMRLTTFVSAPECVE